MKKKYLLPELKNEETVESTGCWENHERIYDFLLENMKLYFEPRSSIFENGSNSYPHLFEQMILFHNSFLDDRDADHDRAIAEWRACLAILALPIIMNIKLDMIKVDFQSSKNVFLQAAAYFRPDENPVFYLTTWDYSYVLCMDGEPIAILSPVTLICPAKQFRKRIKKLRWIVMEKQNGREQVTFDFKGNGNEYSCMRYWLYQLSSQIKRNPDDIFVEDTYRKVMDEIKQYLCMVEKEGTAETEVKARVEYYHSMNSNWRKEYKFFNFCCDFGVTDPALEFLKQCYCDDIFQDKLLVILYDTEPDAMYQPENISKMEDLFRRIPELNGERLIAVRKSDGTRMPVYILLPFRDNFAKELTSRNIFVDKVLEECRVEYAEDTEEICIVMRMKGFPKAYEKIYSRQNWKYLYGTELASIYIWPRYQMNQDKWKAYFIFYASSADIKVEILDAKDCVVGKTNTKKQKEMHVLRTYHFPAYVRYEFKNVSGYLPLSIQDRALNENGGTATVFVHMGHSVTYVKIQGGNRGETDREYLGFEIPKSLRIVGEECHDSEIYGYFVDPDADDRTYAGVTQDRKYFRNMLHSFWRNYTRKYYTEIRPMQDGQIIFDEPVIGHAIQENMLSFFCFEYNLMDEKERRDVHLFLEEILLYAAYLAVKRGYTNMRVEYLYAVNEAQKLGELEGLWRNAFEWVKKWTGIDGQIGQAIGRMHESEALAWLLYYHIYKNSDYNLKDFTGDPKELYVGVDIGWSKTLVCMFGIKKNNENEVLERRWTQIDFAGRDISMMNGSAMLEDYPENLSILLRGAEKIGNGGKDDGLLCKFRNMNMNQEREEDEYQGLFDILAMKIEEAAFQIPPDVYNRKQQFRAFIETMTYNIFMLFLNIGYIVGKMYHNGQDMGKKASKIHVFLSGNGAKFLNWVSNTKNINKIDETNGRAYFICKTNMGLPEVVREGVKIGIEAETCEIVLANAEEQLIDGCIFKKSFEKFKNYVVAERFYTNEFECTHADTFCDILDDVKQSFSDAVFKIDNWGGMHIGKSTATEVIQNEAKELTKQLAQAIQEMGNKEGYCKTQEE